MVKTKQTPSENYDRIQNFLNTYNTRDIHRRSKDINKSIKYRAKNAYPTISDFTKEFVDEQGVQYAIAYGKKAKMWYDDKDSTRLNLSSGDRNRFGEQYFFIKVPKLTRESGGIPESGSDRTLVDSIGNVIVISVSDVNIGNRRATGELFVDGVTVVKRVV